MTANKPRLPKQGRRQPQVSVGSEFALIDPMGDPAGADKAAGFLN